MAGLKKNKHKQAADNAPPPSQAVDEDLIDHLLAELDSRDQNVQKESALVLKEIQVNAEAQPAVERKPNAKERFQARQARKAATLAELSVPDDPETSARLQREADEEKDSIKRTCEELGVQVHQINPDGHCLFSAVADQLAILSILPYEQANYYTTRLVAANYIHGHPDDFLPFLPSSSGEDGSGATDAGFMSRAEFDAYCTSIRVTGQWGGEPEILALSRAYNMPIHIVQGGSPPIVVHNPTGGPWTSDLNTKRVVRISYHRKLYGLGEHYNSLRPIGKGKLAEVSNAIHSILK